MEAFLSGEALAAPLALWFLTGAYFFLTWKRSDSEESPDTQVGLKVVLFAFIVAGLTITLEGAHLLLTYVLSGFKTGSSSIKNAISMILSGGIVVGGVNFLLLPRTNFQEHPKVVRMFLGAVSGLTGIMAVVMLSKFIQIMINGGGAPWAFKAGSLAGVVAYGAIAFLALSKLGAMSDWTAPVRAAMPPMGGGGGVPQGYPPQQSGGMPQQGYGQQQQQGYPPQQQGYPPQQGGYPPQQQGGGQQQGYPPQQGGYPPQGGGGGYPPQG